VTFFPWFVIGLLILVNAVYVAAEFSAVAAQRSELALLSSGGSHRARRVLSMLEDGKELDRYIAACQIGITLSSLVAGAYAQATIGVELSPWLAENFGLREATAHTSSFFLVLLVLTTLQVLLGELIPKTLALQFPERTVLLTFLPTRASASLYGAFIWLLNGSGFLLLRPFGVKPGGHQHVHSPEEIHILLAESRRGGALSPEAHQRLERGLELSTRTVRHLMTPRGELYAIDVSTPTDEILSRILESPYSRVPVYRGTLDQVIGAVNTKDLADWFAVHGKLPSLSQVLRPIPFVPETLRAHRLVRVLQQQQSSKAIVVSEFGGVQGIISIEDLLSQLFGDIGDELKQPEKGAEELPDGSVRLAGSMGLDEAAPWLGARWQGSATTIGGHVVAHLGRLPTQGETAVIDGVEVTVSEMGPTAVRALLVRPPKPEDALALHSGSMEES
jgi:putative hemolysin